MKIIALTAFWISVGCGVSFGAESLFKNPDGLPLERFQAEGESGMVTTSSPQASDIGVDILKRGGNAADAAIAVSFAISVTRPQSTGLGGGGFLLYFDEKSGETFVFDFRETAPNAASRDMYLEDGKVVPGRSREGALAVGVPGTVAGLLAVHKKFGTMPLRDLIAPAQKLAKEGFLVYPELAKRLAGRRELLAKNSAMKAIFFKDGEVLKAGEMLVQTDLGKTLDAIAQKGSRGFYTGFVADGIVAEMKAQGGLITARDLSSYQVKMRKPVRGKYRGYEVVSMPPPSSGGVHLIQMLNMLEGWNLKTFGQGSETTLHLLAECMRQAYADRATYMGDSDFVTVPVKELCDKAYAKTLRELIQPNQARKSSEVSAGKPGNPAAKQSEETTHLSIVDASGNAVSSTQTINYGFGSGIVASGTGVILNNEMDDFSAQPGVPNLYGLVGGEANAVAGGKRPLSSMSPTFLMLEGKPVLVVGAPGGSKIITAVLQTIVNVVDFDTNLYEAVAAPRIHHQWLPDQLSVEKGYYASTVLEALRSMGHKVVESDRSFAQVQAIRIKSDGTRVGASDPRVSGKAAGY